jgi:hypothetical protein
MATDQSKPHKQPRKAAVPPASDRTRGEWLRRVEAEYRSAAITQHLVLWLIQIAASPDLIQDGLRIVTDELKHAELSHRTYVAAGGKEPPKIARESLGLRRSGSDPLEHDVLRTGVEIFCLGETVAVRLFKELRSECVAPSAKRALDRILKDEVRHRDFGWALFEWLSETPLGPDLVALAGRELPRMFARLRGSYAPEAARRETSLPEADRAWGLMPTRLYAEILDEVLERDYVPRFSRFGIDAKAAWDASTRAPRLEATA